jgi:Sodium:dicarboxylate symporter family
LGQGRNFDFRIKCFHYTGVFLCLISVFLWGHKFPVSVLSFFYACSLSLRQILSFILPFLIATSLGYFILSFGKKSLTILPLLLGMVIFSDYVSLLFAYSSQAFAFIPSVHIDVDSSFLKLQPLWSFSLPKVLNNEHGILLGLSFISLLFIRCSFLENVLYRFRASLMFFLKKILLPLFPLMILGSIMNLQHEGVLVPVLTGCLHMFVLILCLESFYLIMMHFCAAGFRFRATLNNMKACLPALFTGMMTASSEAALPQNILAAEKNQVPPHIASVVMSSTLNIHMLGDSITIPVVIMTTLKIFGFPDMSFADYVWLSGYLMIAKFAAGSIPLGSIMSVLPLLTSSLGFTSDMSVFIVILYMVFDPFATAGNVFGNGAFVIVFNKVLNALKLHSLYREGFPEDISS